MTILKKSKTTISDYLNLEKIVFIIFSISRIMIIWSVNRKLTNKCPVSVELERSPPDFRFYKVQTTPTSKSELKTTITTTTILFEYFGK